MKIKKVRFFFLIICIAQLFYLFQYRSGFRYDIIKNAFNEDAGIIYSVSAEVIESRKILKENNISNFNLSKKIRENQYFYERFIEFNYPARINNSSDFTFFLINEKKTNNCKIIETKKYLKLTKC